MNRNQDTYRSALFQVILFGKRALDKVRLGFFKVTGEDRAAESQSWPIECVELESYWSYVYNTVAWIEDPETDQIEDIIQVVQYSYSTTSIHQLYIVRFFFLLFSFVIEQVSGVWLGHYYITAVGQVGATGGVEPSIDRFLSAHLHIGPWSCPTEPTRGSASSMHWP